ncbi:MAG: glyoxalase/bleomycin resistance/extradiol dioxygenase family protein [Ginsengibacter sp.]
MKLFPYLSFPGNCEEAVNFYKEALNGEIIQMGRYGESPMKSGEELKDKIIHARLQFGDALIMASDVMDGNLVNLADNISLSVDCDTDRQLEEVFSKMAKGGVITMPLKEQFWGATFGMLTDKFGIHWMFNCEKKKIETGEEEMLDIV